VLHHLSQETNVTDCIRVRYLSTVEAAGALPRVHASVYFEGPGMERVWATC